MINDIEEISLLDLDIELASREVWEFCLFMDFDFFSKRSFLRDVADLFQWLVQKEETPIEIRKRLLSSKYLEKKTRKTKITSGAISMPPRAGKSYTISLASAWGIGRRPKESILRCTATATLYNSFSRHTRGFINSDKFKKVFGIELIKDNQAVQSWGVKGTKQGSYFGAGVGGSIIGKGATLIAITDDLFKGLEQAQNIEQVEKVNEWYNFDFGSRLESGCAMLDIGTRWRDEDVIGSGVKKDKYDIVIKIPALIDNKTFCNHVNTTKTYLQKKEDLDPVFFQPMYMQSPINAVGLLFPNDNLNYFDISELRVGNNYGWLDTADTGTDNISLPIVSVHNSGSSINIYLIDVIYSKSDMTELEPYIAQAINQYNLIACGYETNQFGMYGAKKLQKIVQAKIIPVFETKNKHFRIVSKAPYIKKNFYFRNDNMRSKEYIDFMDDFFSYEKSGKNKRKIDAPDSLSGLANMIIELGY